MNSSKKIIFLFLMVAFGVVLLRTAWVGDDAYITMRAIDNFVRGYGFTWNVGERVQTYTHPLWMLLLLGVYAVTQHAYGSIMFLSMTLSLTTVGLVLAWERDDFILFIGWGMLVLSNAFVDYSTSGLENPATHLILAIFVYHYLGSKSEMSKKHFLTLLTLAGLATLNRLDTLLLYFPPLVEIILRKEARKNGWLIMIGFLPFLLWEIFSIIYYGFPFPNTYYAKLHTGISSYALMRQGVLYFFNSLAWDPITLFVIGTALVLSLTRGTKQQRMLSIGILLYLAYVLKIGGDFMSGRYFSAPFLASVLLIMKFIKSTEFTEKIAFLLVVVFLGFMAHTPSFSGPLTRDDALENLTGVSDEQAYYYRGTGLLRWGSNSDLPQSEWVDEGKQLQQSDKQIFVGKGIGFLGFYAGPNVHVIDYFAISDPFLSHLPVASTEKFLIGHFRRALPTGYIATLKTGMNQLQDAELAEFYNKIVLITRGPIWNAERWKTIWKMNTGQYDYLLNE